MNIDLGPILTIIDQYGLPLAMLGIGGWLWLSGRVVSGRAAADELLYRETLRLEERTARIAAEARLDRQIELGLAATEAIRDLEATVLKSRV